MEHIHVVGLKNNKLREIIFYQYIGNFFNKFNLKYCELKIKKKKINTLYCMVNMCMYVCMYMQHKIRVSTSLCSSQSK